MLSPQSRQRPLSSTRTSFLLRDRITISFSTTPVQSFSRRHDSKPKAPNGQSYLRFALRFVFFAGFFAFFAFFAMLSS
jgi:hypothetical protein